MIPSEYPLTLYHGDSYQWQFVLWLDVAKTQPLDLTGVVVKAEIRETSGAPTIFALTCNVSLPNTIAMTLPADLCRTIPVAGHMWDCQLTFPDGSVNTILAGPVSITPDITDSDSIEVLTQSAEPQAVKAPRLQAVPRRPR
jgi:hypothetical protein